MDVEHGVNQNHLNQANLPPKSDSDFMLSASMKTAIGSELKFVGDIDEFPSIEPLDGYRFGFMPFDGGSEH